MKVKSFLAIGLAILCSCASKNPSGSDDNVAGDALSNGTDSAMKRDASGNLYLVNAPVKISTSPFQSQGYWLNAYYVVREEVSYKGLSQLLYGRDDREDLLARWNKNRPLVVGSVIYYNSPFRPEDRQKMLHFAEDFGGQLQSYTIQSGDSLSKLAETYYGNMALWKELSATNPEIRKPDLVYVGQVIHMAPAKVDTRTALNQLLKLSQKTVAEAAPQPSPAQVTAPAKAEENSEIVTTDVAPTPSRFAKIKAHLLQILGALLSAGALGFLIWRRLQAKKPLGNNTANPLS